MGCDIHCILQKKQKDQWVDKEILDLHRNYSLFGVLGSVRGTFEVPISEPRGLPTDFVIKTIRSGQFNKDYPEPNEYLVDVHPTKLKSEYNGKPGYFWLGEHSFSYLTLDEINKYKHWDEIEYVQQEFKDLFFRCPNLKNWRIIFGFDS